MTIISLRAALQSLPENAPEPVVNDFFAPHLLRALGSQSEEIHPEYNTGDGAVDKAARKTIGDDVFLYTKSNPYFLLELKGRDINLSEDAAQYQKTVHQLKRYLLAPNCKTVQWGIITNSCHIQLDAPPNWRVFSQLAVYAADVILIPTKHNNLFSLENAAMAMKKFIPEVQSEKADGSPIPLPIFFNGEKITPPQLAVAQQEINNILKTAKKEGFDLLSYFYPRYTNAKRDLHIHEVPKMTSEGFICHKQPLASIFQTFNLP